jgi:hypothetical protein
MHVIYKLIISSPVILLGFQWKADNRKRWDTAISDTPFNPARALGTQATVKKRHTDGLLYDSRITVDFDEQFRKLYEKLKAYKEEVRDYSLRLRLSI